MKEMEIIRRLDALEKRLKDAEREISKLKKPVEDFSTEDVGPKKTFAYKRSKEDTK